MPEYRAPGKEAVRMGQLQRWLEEKRKKAKQAEQELDFAAMSTIKEEQDKKEQLERQKPEKEEPDKYLLRVLGVAAAVTRINTRATLRAFQIEIEALADEPEGGFPAEVIKKAIGIRSLIC